MKPTFLISFLVMFVSTALFALVYTQWTDVVQANPTFFAVGLVTIITLGMCGITTSMMTGPALEAQRVK